MKPEIEIIEEEILTNGSRKIVLGVRCYPELKNKLTQEATDLGITLSELTENILLNKERLQYEKRNSEEEVERLKKEISKLNNLSVNSNQQLKEENEVLKIENERLKKSILTMNDQVSIFNDKRLLQLFAELKWEKDTIITADKQTFSITYNSPKDLLTAMIYSFQIKKI